MVTWSQSTPARAHDSTCLGDCVPKPEKIAKENSHGGSPRWPSAGGQSSHPGWKRRQTLAQILVGKTVAEQIAPILHCFSAAVSCSEGC